MPHAAHNPNVDLVEYPGLLHIVERDTREELVVPLQVEAGTGSARDSSLRLFDGGVVHENMPYELTFEYQTTVPIRRAALSVNDHNEFYTTATHADMRYGDDVVFSHSHTVDMRQGGPSTRHPFAFTCGFARVQIRIEFFDGPDVYLTTPDVVSLDEPVRDGPYGESAEEANIQEMYRALTTVAQNQAAEWMFARGNTTLVNRLLSFDNNTDWAYAPMSLRLQVASDALDCIADGLEDAHDAFPTTLPPHAHEERANRMDTDENREVRALLSSMEDQIHRMCDVLCLMCAESREVLGKLRDLIQRETTRRQHRQSLPAIQLIAQRYAREEELYSLTKDLHWRIAEQLANVDDPDDGFGEVAKVPFQVPEPTGVYATDATYANLREAMRIWSICADEPLERSEVSLHALKPDKLFEYFALHKMLGWLWDNGFVEDARHDSPIARFRYGLADWYYKYENEERCANTYRLVRGAGTGAETRVDLYFQPVLYLDQTEENGIDLHRVEPAGWEGQVGAGDGTGAFVGEFWTPDYLLDIRQGGTRRTYLIDAKYCSRDLLNNKMRDCIDKYVEQTARGHESPGTGIAGVALLAGRLDAPTLNVSTRTHGDVEFLRIIAPFNRNTGRRKLNQFFDALGLPAR